MQPYLACLFDHLMERQLARASMPSDYAAQRVRKDHALSELEATFSPEQRKLFLNYEDAENGVSALEMRQLFQETMRLARCIYR